MQLECTNCHQRITLPDDKLPIGRPFSFKCPYCKEKNTATVSASGEISSAPSLLPSKAEATGESSQQPPQADFPSMDQGSQPGEGLSDAHGQYHPPEKPAAVPPTPLRASATADDMYASVAMPAPSSLSDVDDSFNSTQVTLKQILSGEIDDHLNALVVYDDPGVSDMLEQKLSNMGFRVSVAMNQRDAAKQMKFTSFSIILLQEDYYGASLRSNHLLRSIQNMSTNSRRGMLLVLISPTLTTLDDLLAFSLSLDAIINSSDLANIERLLFSTIGRARKFYFVYREILAEHGLD